MMTVQSSTKLYMSKNWNQNYPPLKGSEEPWTVKSTSPFSILTCLARSRSRNSLRLSICCFGGEANFSRGRTWRCVFRGGGSLWSGLHIDRGSWITTMATKAKTTEEVNPVINLMLRLKQESAPLIALSRIISFA